VRDLRTRHERQSSIAARTRSVTSAAVAFQSNGTEMSTSGYDVIRTANFWRSGVATIQPSKRFCRCLPAATTAASSSGLRSRGMVSESKIVIGMNHDFRTSGHIQRTQVQYFVTVPSGACEGHPPTRTNALHEQRAASRGVTA